MRWLIRKAFLRTSAMNTEPNDRRNKPQGTGPAVQIDLDAACQPVPRLLFVEASRRALKLMGNKLQTDWSALEQYPVIPGLDDLPSLELGMQYLQHQFVSAGQPQVVAMAAAPASLCSMVQTMACYMRSTAIKPEPTRAKRCGALCHRKCSAYLNVSATTHR